MGQKKAKRGVGRHQCRECKTSFEFYSELKDHFKKKHEGKYRAVVRYIEETKHVGEVNED